MNPDNNTKANAEIVIGMVAGDRICGISQGSSTTLGNVLTSADTWDISTAALTTPGWYEWTLTVSTSAGTLNTISIRGLNQTGGGDCLNPSVIGTTDSAVQTSTAATGGLVRWYSNENTSRIYVRVTGAASSADYCATLACTPVPVLSAGAYAAGSILFTTVGQGHTTDTDIHLFDSSRTVIPGANCDDTCPNNAAPAQSSLTLPLTAGTYYLAVGRFNTATNDASGIQEDFGTGLVLDFANALANSSATIPTTSNALSFAVDDGSGPVQTVATNTVAFQVVIAEVTVGGGNLVEFCYGDGGDQMGCTNCPCGNNALAGTMGGCLNSVGGSAHLVASGSPDVTTPADTLHFDMTGGTFPGSFAVLISGDNQLPNAGACPPGSGITSGTLDGLRCVGGAALRHGSRALDNMTGATTNGWGPPAAPAAGIGVISGFIAGQTRHFQAFYRELATAGCLTGQNTSNAVTVTFL